MSNNAANPRLIAESDEKRRRTERQQTEDMKELLALPAGRSFLWELLGHCKVNQSVFEPNSRIAYNSGMQDVGHFILARIVKARPEGYLQMMQEHMEEKK